MPDITKISDGMIECAAATDDLDAALKPLMDAAGITTGDVASLAFSEHDDEYAHWRASGIDERRTMLREWLALERLYSDAAA